MRVYWSQDQHDNVLGTPAGPVQGANREFIDYKTSMTTF